MKKFLVLTLVILLGSSYSSFSQESELEPADGGSTSCTSMGPDNKGYCTKYTNGNGTSSYTCLKVGAGCVNCVY